MRQTRSLKALIRRHVPLVLVAAGVSLLGAIFAASAFAAPFGASASMTPQVQYVGDPTGSVFALTVHNTGTVDPIGAVEITRPSASWTIMACPLAPAGWFAARTEGTCRYRSATGNVDDIAPGASNSNFQVKARLVASSHNITGTWGVTVSRSSNFTPAGDLAAATAESPGLTLWAYSFQVIDAVVDPVTTTPGSACPASAKQAISSSTGHTLVICGRNRTTATLTPVSAQSTIGGTFVNGGGTFASAPIAPTPTSVILGSWSNVTITSATGTGKTVVARIGSALNHTSPVRIINGYTALNSAPLAVDDVASTTEATSTSFDPRTNDTDAESDPLTITATGGTPLGTVTITGGGTGLTYNPNGQFNALNVGDTASDTFTYTVSDGNGGTDTATVTVTVTGLNDAPVGVADSFTGANSALAGVTLAVSTSLATPNVPVVGNVLTNDTDVDNAQAGFTATSGSSSTNAGAVSMNTNGTFSYTPAPGFIGSDTISYTVHDNNATNPLTATGTITVDVTGPRVWFVNPGGAAGNGTSASPFASLAPLSTSGAADSLDGTGDVIFVYQGVGNAATGGFVLETNQRLAGQPQGLSVTDNLSRTFGLVSAGGVNPTLSNSAGSGLTLDSGNTVQAVTVSGSSSNGVTGSSVTTATIASNVLISGNGGAELNLSAGGGTVAVAATITNGAAGRAVSIASRTSGTVSLTGAVTDAGGTGVSLMGNTGSTVAFSGGLGLSTAGNAAFTATGGGTVTVDNAGVVNTLATTSGIALNVQSTTIGALGLKFRSIAAHGAVNGILLNTTGSSGGLTVTGTGTAGTGGTITNSTDSGVHATSTTNLNLSWMTITNNGNALNEGGLRLVNVFGTGQLTSSTVTGGFEDNVSLSNDSGTLSGFTIQGPNCFIGNNNSASGNTGISVLATLTSTMTTTINNCAFSGNRTDTIHTDTADSSVLTATITNNTITGGSPNQGNIGIDVSSALTSTLTYDVEDNKIGTNGVTNSPLLNHGINVFAGNNSTATGKVVNNTIVLAGAGVSGTGIRLFQSDSGILNSRVTSNTVSNVGFDFGIDATDNGSGIGASTGKLNVMVANNNVSVLPAAINAIRVRGRRDTTTCTSITSNTATTNGGGNALSISQANTAVYRFEIVPPPPVGSLTDATAQAEAANLNPAAVGAEAFSTTGNGITGVVAGSCTGIPGP